MSLNPFDLFDIRSLLSEEERAVQATVARFTDTRVLPWGNFSTATAVRVSSLSIATTGASARTL